MTFTTELRFRAGDASLAGVLTLPEVGREARLPWAVLVPSWLPRDRDGGWDRGAHPAWYAPDASDARDPGLFARLAEALAGLGVASLRYDPRGCGTSEGSWEESDLFTRIDDVRDAVGAMRSRRDLDLRRAALIGHGEGAGVVMSVAIGDPAIGALGLIGPTARGFRDVLRRGAAERDRTGRDREHPFIAALDRGAEELIERVERAEPRMRLADRAVEADLRLAGWEQAFHMPPIALATMLHRNVVVAHGAEDVWADPSESVLLVETLRAAGNDPVRRLVRDCGHDLAEAEDAEIGAMADALVQRMDARELPPVLLAIEQMGADG